MIGNDTLKFDGQCYWPSNFGNDIFPGTRGLFKVVLISNPNKIYRQEDLQNCKKNLVSNSTRLLKYRPRD